MDEDAGEEEVNRFWREDHGAEERHQRLMDMAQHPEQYPPGRSEFLETIARMPLRTGSHIHRTFTRTAGMGL